MATNTRALRFKANAHELEEKLSDIKRLVGCLERFVNEVIASVEHPEWTSLEATDSLDGNLEIFARYSRAVKTNWPMEFEFWAGATLLKRDSQFNLTMVRHVHNNLDVLIKCAESICEDAGCLVEFHAKMARFDG